MNQSFDLNMHHRFKINAMSSDGSQIGGLCLLVQVQYSPPWVIQFVDKKTMTVLSATYVPSPSLPP